MPSIYWHSGGKNYILLIKIHKLIKICSINNKTKSTLDDGRELRTLQEAGPRAV